MHGPDEKCIHRLAENIEGKATLLPTKPRTENNIVNCSEFRD
jgi:hypothetical protein